MTPTTDLQKLLAEATKGPWRAKANGDGAIIGQDGDGSVVIAEALVGIKFYDEYARKQFPANARLIAMAPDLAVRVIELEAENKRLRGYIEGMILEMEKFNQRGCGRNCYMEGDWFDVSEARAALKGGEI